MNNDFSELILSEKFQLFLSENYQENIPNLILKNPFPSLPNTLFGDQVLGKKLAKSKFPSFFNRNDIMYPPHLNLEQSTAEKVACYRKGLFQVKNKTFADFTAGFGVDAYWMSQGAENCLLLEPNISLYSVLQNNSTALFGDKEIRILNESVENFIARNGTNEIFDVAFIDPSRRDNHHQKTYEIEDLSPNVVDLLPLLKIKCKKVICKFSPMMNIRESISKLNFVSEVHLIALKNELKEICIVLDFENKNQNFICTAHEISPLSKLTITLNSADFSQNKRYEFREYSAIKEYLYLPNVSISKAIQYFESELMEKFNIYKIHPNTHIFTSEMHHPHFPGRVFQVQKTEGKNIVKQDYSQIISKNYGMTPEQIIKKFKLKIKGSKSLIFTQDINSYAILEALEMKKSDLIS